MWQKKDLKQKKSNLIFFLRPNLKKERNFIDLKEK